MLWYSLVFYLEVVLWEKKVDLRMNEENKYLIIKNLVETNGNKKCVAIKVDIKLKVQKVNIKPTRALWKK